MTHAGTTSIAAQSVAELGGERSVLARQKRDHVRLDELLQRLSEAPPTRQDAVLLDIYRLVFPHAFAEEAVLWPVIRRVLPNGHALTLQVEREHQRINELVIELEALEPGSLAHGQVLERVVALLREDVRDEEDALLPRLQAKLSPAKLRLLGLAWGAVRAIAPTRAHPVVSRRPPGNMLSALPLAGIDRARDLVDARLHRARGQAGPRVKAFAAVLARAAHAVERLPGLRSGEDPSTHIGRRGGSAGTALMLGFAGTVMLALASRRRRKSAA